MAKAHSLNPQDAWGEVAVILTDDAGIRNLNRRHFHVDDTTDVISFRYDPLPGETHGTADIIINVQRAAQKGRHAGMRAWTAFDELALYTAHGCDHLHGNEDSTPIQRKRMRRRELRWLTEARRAGLISGLLNAQQSQSGVHGRTTNP